MSNDRKYDFAGDPTADEVAATLAAIERFLADTSSAPPAESDELVSGWLRAALAVGIGSSDDMSIW